MNEKNQCFKGWETLVIIIFNYEEDLNERASIGHSRTEEYTVRGKKLVKLKHDME